MLGRNRVTYASECLFVGYTATGYQFRDGALRDDSDPAALAARGLTSRRNLPWGDNSGNFAEQLHRIQNIDYSINITRTPVYQYGELGRLDNVITSTSTVNLDFSYYLTEGCNEQKLELVINGENNAFWHHYQTQKYNNYFNYGQYDGKNFFIETSPDVIDLKMLTGERLEENKNVSVISLGNCFLTNYSIEASVGNLATANVSFEGLNVQVDTGMRNIDTPALNNNGGMIPDIKFSLPDYTQDPMEGSPAAISQGDLIMDLSNQGMCPLTPSGTGFYQWDYYDGSAYIQSFQLEVDLSRTPLERLGQINSAAYTRAIDFPVAASLRVSALVSELKENNLINYICESGNTVNIYMYKQCFIKSPDNLQMLYQLRDCELKSEQFTSAIGDNKVVDLVFTTSLGAKDEISKGVFISGRCHDDSGLIAREKQDSEEVDDLISQQESASAFFKLEGSERD